MTFIMFVNNCMFLIVAAQRICLAAWIKQFNSIQLTIDLKFWNRLLSVPQHYFSSCHRAHKLSTLDNPAFDFIRGTGFWLWWGVHPPSYPHDRILSRMCLTHGFLPPIVGTQPCPCTSVFSRSSIVCPLLTVKPYFDHVDSFIAVKCRFDFDIYRSIAEFALVIGQQSWLARDMMIYVADQPDMSHLEHIFVNC